MPRRIVLKRGQPASTREVRDATPDEVAAVLNHVYRIDSSPSINEIIRIIHQGGTAEERAIHLKGRKSKKPHTWISPKRR